MTPHEASIAETKLSNYKGLSFYRERLYTVLQELQNQQGFTGNTRESRRILSLGIGFSATRGCAPAAQDAFDFPDYVIEASELGNFLIEKVRARIAYINEQISAI